MTEPADNRAMPQQPAFTFEETVALMQATITHLINQRNAALNSLADMTAALDMEMQKVRGLRVALASVQEVKHGDA